MPNSNQCPREAQPFDPDSAGVIEDDERVCRGAFAESHYNAKGEIKIALITEGKLLAGELSVYRASAKANFAVDQVAAQLRHSNPVTTLKNICSATAAEIRSLQLEWAPGRFFCIVDDPVIDDYGTKHPAHGVIKLCKERQVSRGDSDFIAIRQKLHLLFVQTISWVTPAAA